MMGASGQNRRAELARIHCAKRDLGLDDATYRDVVRRVSAQFRGEPVESAGAMTAEERRALLDEFRRLGFEAAPPRGREGDWIETDVPHLKKLLACVNDLVEVGAIRRPASRKLWLRRFVKKLTGVDDLRWLTPEQTNTVIEALKGWRKRVESGNPDAPAPAPAPAPAEPDGRAGKVRTARAAAFEVMAGVTSVQSPVEAIRLFVELVSKQEYPSPEAEAEVAVLLRGFGERVRLALRYFDYPQVARELERLLDGLYDLAPEAFVRILQDLGIPLDPANYGEAGDRRGGRQRHGRRGGRK